MSNNEQESAKDMTEAKDSFQLSLEKQYGAEKAAEILRDATNLEKHLLNTGFGDIAREDLVKNILEGKDSFQLSLEKQYGTEKAAAILRNITYLEKQLLNTGFGDIPREDLIKNILKGKDSFQLTLSKKYGTDEATATLNFNKSDKGNYFFNNYELAIKTEGVEEAFKQRFKVNYGNTFTLKEAYNLMKGRSVFKEFIKVDRENAENNQKYTAWATMDFKQADEEGNHAIKKRFNLKLEDALADYPFKELANNQYKNDLIASLARGNRQQVTYVKDGVETKMKVEANPVHNGLKLYDEKDNPLMLSMKHKEQSQAPEVKEGQEQIQEADKEQKVATSAEKEDEPGPQTRRRGRRAA